MGKMKQTSYSMMYNEQKEEDTKKPLIVYADVINEEDYE